MKTYMYYRVSYSKKNDSFSTWTYVGPKKDPDWDDFGLEMECRCRRALIDETNEIYNHHDYIDYHLLTGVRQAMQWGYKVSFNDRPEEVD